MSLRTLEAEILRGARTALNNTKLRQKDILEWTTGDIEPHEGEVVMHVPGPGVFVAVATEHDKRKQP